MRNAPRSKPSGTVRLEGVRAIKETDAALLCDIDGSEEWIPKSQIDRDSEVQSEDDYGDLVVSRWIAERRGLV